MTAARSAAQTIKIILTIAENANVLPVDARLPVTEVSLFLRNNILKTFFFVLLLKSKSFII
ncbi:hypothetical protein CFS9_38100 [Flavobacterium sp. CFS9]|uniref:Uncharacterized protein n=1 Tax=Flavobacterium sp. CFS9 TaxID=3143118 RepID=A0AAT9H6P1_9FLAO